MVVIVPVAGTVVWLLFGRPQKRRRGGAWRASSEVGSFPEYDRPVRFVAQDPAADAEFLQRCRERAEQQRREAELRRRQSV